MFRKFPMKAKSVCSIRSVTEVSDVSCVFKNGVLYVACNFTNNKDSILT